LEVKRNVQVRIRDFEGGVNALHRPVPVVSSSQCDCGSESAIIAL
jgi:hypothetical protein